MDLATENKIVSANKTRYCAITNCREQQLNKMQLQFQFLFCIEFVAYFPFDVDLVLFVDATAAAAVFLPFVAAVAIGMACFCPIQKNS